MNQKKKQRFNEEDDKIILACMEELGNVRNPFVIIAQVLSNFSPKQICNRWRNYTNPKLCRSPLRSDEKKFINDWISKRKPSMKAKSKINKLLKSKSDSGKIIKRSRHKRYEKVIEWKILIQDLKEKFGCLRSENDIKNYWYPNLRGEVEKHEGYEENCDLSFEDDEEEDNDLNSLDDDVIMSSPHKGSSNSSTTCITTPLVSPFCGSQRLFCTSPFISNNSPRSSPPSINPPRSSLPSINPPRSSPPSNNPSRSSSPAPFISNNPSRSFYTAPFISDNPPQPFCTAPVISNNPPQSFCTAPVVSNNPPQPFCTAPVISNNSPQPFCTAPIISNNSPQSLSPSNNSPRPFYTTSFISYNSPRPFCTAPFVLNNPPRYFCTAPVISNNPPQSLCSFCNDSTYSKPHSHILPPGPFGFSTAI